MIRLVLAVIAVLASTLAHAEVVFVRSANEHGQGWLFGTRDDQTCWLALPWHVVDRLRDTSDRRLVFTDQNGRSGETAAPVHVSEIPAALAAAGDDDLAFARVTAGRKIGDCPSRLGLPPLAFTEALNDPHGFVLTLHQQTSTVRFDLEMLRSRVDDVGGGRLLFRAVRDADAGAIMGGASGAVISSVWNGMRYPVAMALAVPQGTQNLLALRFDRIAAAFAAIEQPGGSARTEGADQPAISVIGIVADADVTPLASIVNNRGCWRASPPAGRSYVEFTLLMPNPGYARQLNLDIAPDCGGPTEATIEERIPGETGWRALSYACRIGPTAGDGCRIGRRTPREFRFRLRSPEGIIGLSAITSG